jgi:bifunctional enzyme CysN/CysC
MIVRPGNVPRASNNFEAMLVWMSPEPMVPGRSYLFKHTTQTVPGQIDSLRYRVDVNSLHRSPAPELQLNEIGRCSITLSQPIYYDPYRRNRSTGAFVVIDKISNLTVAAGMISARELDSRQTMAPWEIDDSVQVQADDSVRLVTGDERQARLGQKPATVLLTGLSGSGKSTIARGVERALFDAGRLCIVLDGEDLRRGLSRDLGFSAEDRSENLRRCAHAARLLNENGFLCVASLIAPSEEVREKVADLIGRDRFLVVHVDAPLDVCQQRDPRGHYQKAQQGEIPRLPGAGTAYQPPVRPDLVLRTDQSTVAQCVQQVVELLKQQKFIS